MTDVSVLIRGLKDRPALLSFLSAAFLIGTLFIAFSTRWETGDDLAMSMVAHGYGFAAYGSPNLLYSNVLWGYFVRALPSLNGVLGYSLATIAVLMAVAWATLYFLLRLGSGYFLGLMAMALVLARPAIFPQHVINAGLLTMAAVLGWRVAARSGPKGVGSLAAACMLAFSGYLIRDKEFFLVLAVAAPLLPWQALWRDRSMQTAVAALILAIALAAGINHAAYSGSEWKNFRELDLARAPFSDFHAGDHLQERPDILARHGYSKNDIELISNNFFVDPRLADPKALRAMLAELGPLFAQKGSLALGVASLKALTLPSLLPLLFSGLLLLFIIPRRSGALAWFLCLAVSFAVGMMGRPGFLRVYLPLLSLMVVAPLALGEVKAGPRRGLILVTLFLACVASGYLLTSRIATAKFFMTRVKRDIQNLPAEVIFTWGGPTFPYELAFPVLSNDTKPRKIKLDPLYTFTYAPFSISVAEQKEGRGLIQRLCSAEGAPVITSEKRTALLGVYCRERLNGHLQVATVYEAPTVMIQQLRCVTNP